MDAGTLWVVRNHLQNAADASALAAAAELPDEVVARTSAGSFANQNANGHSGILAPSDVLIGNWNLATRVFTPNGNPRNAVRVSVERSDPRGNAVELNFARLLGRDTARVVATATAYTDLAGPGTNPLIVLVK
jgi:Flp pilus assembly protein TadG